MCDEFPLQLDTGMLCVYNDMPVLIIRISECITQSGPAWVDVMTPDGQFVSVNPWKCKSVYACQESWRI